LKYPLDDRTRQPMPAGGLFSTASDLSLFCRMILGGGGFGGKRYLSEKSLQQMTSTQTGALPASYGFGWSADRKPGGPFGHGGAYSTNMQIDPARQLITIFLVQHAGWPGEAGGRVLSTFQQAAVQAFGK
jgi:CubicO group peptidase (beta-lactamase class C family)